MGIYRRFASLSLIIFLSQLCLAQQDMGYITGRVMDDSGGVLPGVDVVAVNVDTGIPTVTLTTETGSYTAGPLRIGTYEISVQVRRFKRSVAENIMVHAQDRVRVNLILQLGEITEEISVLAGTPLLQSENATLSQAIETRDIAQLPLATRNFQQLAMLSAGVIPAVGSRDWQGGFNSHGQRFLQNNFIIDGVDNNSHIMGLQDRKAQVMIPSLDAVQEFKIETSNYSAEFGRNSGAVMNVSVKGGTNAFHGSVYEYIRNDFFDARPTFAYIDRDRDGKADLDVLRRNQFGFSFGGPIAKNRSFFFFSWEGLRISHSQSLKATVPGSNEAAGYFAPDLYGLIYDPLTKEPFPDNTIPQDRMTSTAVKLLGIFPASNTTALATRENYASGPPWTEGRDQYDTRIDHAFGDNNQIFGRFSKMRFNQRRESVLPLPARGAAGNNWAEDDNDAHTAAIGYTHTLSPTMVNETRIGYRRLKVDKVPLTAEDAAQLNSQFGIKGVPTFAGVTGLTPSCPKIQPRCNTVREFD